MTNVGPLAGALLICISGCRSFPLVDNAIIAAPVGGSVEYICAERMPDGKIEERKGDACNEALSCVVSDPEGNSEILPIQSCNNWICHSPRHYERIMKWGKKHCK